LALLAVLLVGISYFFLDDQYQTSFAGFGALIAIPGALGGLLAYAIGINARTGAMGCFVWPTVALLALCGVAAIFLGEGAICIAMVLPIWMPAAVVGYAVSVWNMRRVDAANGEDASRLQSVGWLLLPLLAVTLDNTHPPEWESRAVTREVIIEATPEKVWPLLVTIPDIAPSEGAWNITQNLLGVPRPTGAALVGEAGQMIRKAEWSGGIRFDERIDHIEPLRAIHWTFAFPNDSIQRHVDRHVSPSGAILKIQTGRYELEPLSPTQTRVRLTTRYAMRTRLDAYLAWWGEQLLGDVQANVLAIVKQRVGGGAR
jgi:uncharacterized protein YndB with AHSA1/START domain